MSHFKVAVDGPSGAGKSTVVKILAEKLGLRYVDTGATFRSVGLKVLNEGLNTKNKEDVLSVLEDLDFKVVYDKDGNQINLLDGENVNSKIRTPQASIASSEVSIFKEVRLKLVDIWRKIAQENDVIMDGRDIGTFVLPDANVKLFLTASEEERTMRRFRELQEKGVHTTLEEVNKAIEERDYKDNNREFSPAKMADDAIEFDTTAMTIEEVVSKLENIIIKIKMEG